MGKKKDNKYFSFFFVQLFLRDDLLNTVEYGLAWTVFADTIWMRTTTIEVAEDVKSPDGL